MKIQAIKTSIFQKGMNLIDFILQHTDQKLKENVILSVTSKIVSIAEDRIVPKASIDKKKLVQRECDHYLGEVTYGCHLTIHHGLLLPSAGIDESNSSTGGYILYPKDPFSSVSVIALALKKALGLKNLGVILTDSHTVPLRRGVMGIALAYHGFRAVNNMVGQPDLFDRALAVTQVNIVDALAASSVLLMGEGGESRPLALIEQAPVVFTDTVDPTELSIPVEEDLYSPLYKK